MSSEKARELIEAYEHGRGLASASLEVLAIFHNEHEGPLPYAYKKYGEETGPSRMFLCGFNEVFKARRLSLVRHADRTYTVEVPNAES